MKVQRRKNWNEASVSPGVCSACSEGHDSQITSNKYCSFQSPLPNVTPLSGKCAISAYTLLPLTYTPVGKIVCEEQFRNLPGNQSTDLYLLLYPAMAAPVAGGRGEVRTDENRTSPRQGDVLYAGQNRWSKCGGKSKDIACSVSILQSKRFSWDGGRQESHIYNCWLSFIHQPLDSFWNALIQPQSCLQRGEKGFFLYNSKWNSLCNCNCFLFHQLHHPGQENEIGNRLGSNLNTCW